MTTVKPASTIMLARRLDDNLEILLLKRNKALAFAGGLWVFPGGKIEEEELAFADGELAAAKLAATRETKEEANINIAPEDLIFFRHWTTPTTELRRFATYFFFGSVDHDDSEVTVDDSEIKEHLWISPQAALDKVKAGELSMLPPTIMSLQLIRKCQSIEEISAQLLKEEPIYILPVLQTNKGEMICMYQGDAGYSSGNAEIIGARHRLTLNFKKRGFTFEFKDCEGVLPVNGGMHL